MQSTVVPQRRAVRRAPVQRALSQYHKANADRRVRTSTMSWTQLTTNTDPPSDSSSSAATSIGAMHPVPPYRSLAPDIP
eukprot:660112-Rhodomonas_salina.1